jgi:alpha-amylase/alpha-mannosidase (GH57 family)
MMIPKVSRTSRPDAPNARQHAPGESRPPLLLALLWHQHQPLYRDPASAGTWLLHPWVRLHALRDYYGMAALAAEYPDLHLTVNLTPVLLEQLDDYVERGGSDRALDLTRTPTRSLTDGEREEILRSFFDADWHHQIFPHPRYKELFLQRQQGAPFSEQDVTDLRMWFNLAWFATEFRKGPVELITRELVDVHRFVIRGSGFTEEDVREMVDRQHRILRAVVPLHSALQKEGRVEVTTTPWAHPILPLLVDTDQATLDRPGTRLPRRFAYPEDAREHVRRARADYVRRFGRPPRGLWPAEGAVSPQAAAIVAETGVAWIATDQGVLARSGRWGYRVEDPAVLDRPWRLETSPAPLAVFFRDTGLSDAIGFRYQHAEAEEAAGDFLRRLKERWAPGAEGRVVSVILDGENAWGGYPDDGRPFLRALYRRLSGDPDVRTVTFGEYLEGDSSRGIHSHPPDELEEVHDLFTGSWIDELGSAPGVDLGTWIGEVEENRAWELLLGAREAVESVGATTESHPAALDSLLAAEGSDWFWWYGDDQDSGNDAEFDALFRKHLRGVYAGLGVEPPPELARPLVPRTVVWTFAAPVERIFREEGLTVVTNCPGVLEWRVDDGAVASATLSAAGGVMAGARRFHVTVGPFADRAGEVRFRFLCRHIGCSDGDPCCSPEERRVLLA